MAYAILRVAKQKGGSVGASGHHNDRTRETPNADRDRTEDNRVLVGDERNVWELVREVIDEHGGKPRSDSVECVEMVLTASPEHFLDDDEEEREKKIERFAEKALEFLKDERNCGVCVKAVLHLDERTPHVHAHKVPIDPEGKLNAKHYLGGRQKLRELQDRYAEAMAPLGLERGREGSRATHQTVKQFYAAIEKEPVLTVSLERIPDPPSLMVTKEQKKAYKKSVLKAFNEQVAEPLRALNHQAMLARHERGQREEAERKAEEAERQAAERVAATERAAAERVEKAERTAAEVLKENDKLREVSRALLGERTQLRDTLKELGREKDEVQLRADDYKARLSDILMPEVMEKLGYGREQMGEAHVYRDAQGQVLLRVEGQKLLDRQNQVICRNSVDLVIHMRRHNEGVEGYNQPQALEWLRDQFGDKRAAGAAVAHGEQYALEFFGRLREERERSLIPERGTDPWRGPQGRAEDHDRSSRSDHDDRGGGRSFSR